MNSNKRAQYKFGEIEELQQLSCNKTLNVTGEEGIYEVEVTIGTDLGSTGLRYEAFAMPDRFQLFYDNKLVADSKFVGNIPQYRHTLIATVNRELKIFKYNGTSFVDSGETEKITVTESDIANGTALEPYTGKGELKFNKTTTTTVMKLRVIGVIGDTLWNASPICPIVKNTSSTTYKVNTHDLIYQRHMINLTCSEIRKGTIEKFYSLEPLEIGVSVFRNEQLTYKTTNGYLFKGRTIYDITNGVITDKYSCSESNVIR